MIENLDRPLRATSDKLRADMDAAEYMRLAAGPIFGSYISDTFQANSMAMTARLADPADESRRSQPGR
ncbi:hypothetical protein AT984_12325 [Paucibacter sp. KCTC 42545]|nr:hypothetical protein AT984_12325 [Paucibacter sp. KCTC 42545]